MQKKNNFFTKIAKKDYNNRLEEILSQKNFSEEAKNTLLSMFYKIENGYKDYKTVKRDTFEKGEYIEKLINIIDKDCEKITFIPLNGDEEELVNSEEKEIKCKQIESRILYALAKIQKKNIVVKNFDKNIQKALSNMLNIGNNINMVEPLRDFNGFSWNIITKDIEDLNYNLLYQNVIFLTSSKFVDKWVNNYEPLVDYFELFQSQIESPYGKKARDTISKKIIRIALELNSNYDEDFKNEIKKKCKELKEQKEEFENKEKYLEKVSKTKKEIEKKILEIDKIVNDKNLLIAEYEKRNEKLPLEKKIFSIRVLKNNLKEEREEKVKQIENLNNLIKPKKFLETKKNIDKMFEYYDNVVDADYKKEIVNLQKNIIKCMLEQVKNAKEKSKIVELIYKYRYYSLLPLEKNKILIQDDELRKTLRKLGQSICDKAEESKVIIKITTDLTKKYKIIEKLFLSNIIELENINIKVEKKQEQFFITVYDEDIEDSNFELKDITKKELKIKLGKKTKLFI